MSAPFAKAPLRIITATNACARNAASRVCSMGISGIGKTTQLRTLNAATPFSSTSKPANWPSRIGLATKSASATGRWHAISPAGSAAPTPPCATTRATGPDFERVCALFGVPRASTSTTPSSSTASPSPLACASNGARANHRQHPTEPASQTCAAPTGCSARR